jgi:hypothetical protein
MRTQSQCYVSMGPNKHDCPPLTGWVAERQRTLTRFRESRIRTPVWSIFSFPTIAFIMSYYLSHGFYLFIFGWGNGRECVMHRNGCSSIRRVWNSRTTSVGHYMPLRQCRRTYPLNSTLPVCPPGCIPLGFRWSQSAQPRCETVWEERDSNPRPNLIDRAIRKSLSGCHA